jgi:hypothetical protein
MNYRDKFIQKHEKKSRDFVSKKRIIQAQKNNMFIDIALFELSSKKRTFFRIE